MALPPLAQIIDLETMAQYADASAAVANKRCPAVAVLYKAASARVQELKAGWQLTDAWKSEEDLIEEVRNMILAGNKAWAENKCKTSGGAYTVPAESEDASVTPYPEANIPWWVIGLGIAGVIYYYNKKK